MDHATARVRLRALLILIAMVSFLLVAVHKAAPAEAVDLSCNTGSGHVCLYLHSNYGGCDAHFGYNGSNYANNSYDDYPLCDQIGLNDSASSIKNRGNSCDTWHYRHSGYSHLEHIVLKGANVSNLANWDHNDELSSHKWRKVVGTSWVDC